MRVVRDVLLRWGRLLVRICLLLAHKATGVQVGAFRAACSFLGLLVLVDIVAAIAIVEVLQVLVLHLVHGGFVVTNDGRRALKVVIVVLIGFRDDWTAHDVMREAILGRALAQNIAGVSSVVTVEWRREVVRGPLVATISAVHWREHLPGERWVDEGCTTLPTVLMIFVHAAAHWALSDESRSTAGCTIVESTWRIERRILGRWMVVWLTLLRLLVLLLLVLRMVLSRRGGKVARDLGSLLTWGHG